MVRSLFFATDEGDYAKSYETAEARRFPVVSETVLEAPASGRYGNLRSD
jgi:hypothetical protein